MTNESGPAGYPQQPMPNSSPNSGTPHSNDAGYPHAGIPPQGNGSYPSVHAQQGQWQGGHQEYSPQYPSVGQPHGYPQQPHPQQSHPQQGMPTYGGGQPAFGQQGGSQGSPLALKDHNGVLRLGHVSLLATVGALLFVMLGSVGTWASVWGVSVSGLDGDGTLVLILALLAGVLCAVRLFGPLPAKALWGVVAANGLIVLVGLYDIVHISGVAAASVGWGLIFVCFFGLLATAASVMAALRS